MTKRKMKVYDANENFIPVSLVHPEDVRNPWRDVRKARATPWLSRSGHKAEYMDLPNTRAEAVRLIDDWTFLVRGGSGLSWRVTIPEGSRVWLLCENQGFMPPRLIGVELP